MRLAQKFLISVLVLILSGATGCLKLDESITKTANTEAIGADTLGRLLSGLFLSPPTFQAYLNTNIILESNGDGNWTRIDYTGTLAPLVDVAAVTGGSLIGVDGVTDDTIYTSTNGGRTWNIQTVITTGTAPKAITAFGSNVLIANEDGLNAQGRFSTDGGNTWSGSILIHSDSGTASLGDVISNNNRYYVLYSSTPYLHFSTNPSAAWSDATSAPSFPINGATNGLTVLVNYQSTGKEIRYSVDGGDTFSLVKAYSFTTGSAVTTFSNGKFMTALYDSGPAQCQFESSPDGLPGTWTSTSIDCSTASGYTFDDITGISGTYVAGGNTIAPDDPLLVTSQDNGINWTVDSIPVGPNSALNVRKIIGF